MSRALESRVDLHEQHFTVTNQEIRTERASVAMRMEPCTYHMNVRLKDVQDVIVEHPDRTKIIAAVAEWPIRTSSNPDKLDRGWVNRHAIVPNDGAYVD